MGVRKLKTLLPTDFDFELEEVKFHSRDDHHGYRIDLEDQSQLEESQTKLVRLHEKSDKKIPKLVFPEFSPIENQGGQGACQGHANSTGGEQCRVRAGGEQIQLSRACGYYETQRIDGIRGDRGSTISGGVRLLETAGICTEEAWPYPSYYNPRRPPGFSNTTRYKIDGHVMLRDFDKMIDWVAFKGPIEIGITWSGDIDQQVGRDGIVKTYSGRGGGGHAVLFSGLTHEDWRGDPLPGNEPGLILDNSWSRRWGFKGRCIVLRRAIEQMLRVRFNVFAGLYGAATPSLEPPVF